MQIRKSWEGFRSQSLSVAGPLAWSSLPPEVKTSLTLAQFSSRLKTNVSK